MNEIDPGEQEKIHNDLPEYQKCLEKRIDACSSAIPSAIVEKLGNLSIGDVMQKKLLDTFREVRNRIIRKEFMRPVDEPYRGAIRMADAHALQTKLEQGKNVVMRGPSGSGKSTLLPSMAEELGGVPIFALDINKRVPDGFRSICDPENFQNRKYRRISKKPDFWASIDEETLRQQCQEFSQKTGRKAVIVIDELAALYKSPDLLRQVVHFFEDWNAQFIFIANIAHGTSEQLVKDIFHQEAFHHIRPLTREDTQKLIKTDLAGTGIFFEKEAVDALHQALDGAPVNIHTIVEVICKNKDDPTDSHITEHDVKAVLDERTFHDCSVKYEIRCCYMEYYFWLTNAQRKLLKNIVLGQKIDDLNGEPENMERLLNLGFLVEEDGRYRLNGTILTSFLEHLFSLQYLKNLKKIATTEEDLERIRVIQEAFNKYEGTLPLSEGDYKELGSLKRFLADRILIGLNFLMLFHGIDKQKAAEIIEGTAPENILITTIKNEKQRNAFAIGMYYDLRDCGYSLCEYNTKEKSFTVFINGHPVRIALFEDPINIQFVETAMQTNDNI